MRVILIFDIGKTNKKTLVFDEQYQLIFSKQVAIPETVDEDGYPCEDLSAIVNWIREEFKTISGNKDFNLVAVNACAYGASMVYLNEQFQPVLPLYNYLKPFPASLEKSFFSNFTQAQWSLETSSPLLGNLNSGLQLYRLSKEQPARFGDVRYALHLPDFISFLLSGSLHAELTSIGCHTGLWHFKFGHYHRWLHEEGMTNLFPQLRNATAFTTVQLKSTSICAGTALHDSSAAVLPYLRQFSEPFLLISTGTWSISLNPFNHFPLTSDELEKDCLCYMLPDGRQVKAARLFAGKYHEEQLLRIATQFQVNPRYISSMPYDAQLVQRLRAKFDRVYVPGSFPQRDLSQFEGYSEAYHHLLQDITEQQAISSGYVFKRTPVCKIFVDGGFSRNEVFMHFLANAFPACEVYAATLGEASAIGAALVFDQHWNKANENNTWISLRKYQPRDAIG